MVTPDGIPIPGFYCTRFGCCIYSASRYTSISLFLIIFSGYYLLNLSISLSFNSKRLDKNGLFSFILQTE